jgi:hypothetical protein
MEPDEPADPDAPFWLEPELPEEPVIAPPWELEPD